MVYVDFMQEQEYLTQRREGAKMRDHNRLVFVVLSVPQRLGASLIIFGCVLQLVDPQERYTERHNGP